MSTYTAFSIIAGADHLNTWGDHAADAQYYMAGDGSQVDFDVLGVPSPRYQGKTVSKRCHLGAGKKNQSFFVLHQILGGKTAGHLAWPCNIS